jgi:hypothetical protein
MNMMGVMGFEFFRSRMEINIEILWDLVSDLPSRWVFFYTINKRVKKCPIQAINLICYKDWYDIVDKRWLLDDLERIVGFFGGDDEIMMVMIILYLMNPFPLSSFPSFPSTHSSVSRLPLTVHYNTTNPLPRYQQQQRRQQLSP